MEALKQIVDGAQRGFSDLSEGEEAVRTLCGDSKESQSIDAEAVLTRNGLDESLKRRGAIEQLTERKHLLGHSQCPPIVF